MNVNVKVTYVYSLLISLSAGIIGSVSSNLLYDLVGENFYVGLLGAVQGITQMLVAFPAGWWVDKQRDRRSTLLKYMSLLGYLASALTILALLGLLSRGDFGKYIGLLVACVVWGMNDGCVEPTIEALFGDSIPNGNRRTEVESWRSFLSSLGYASGPLTSLLLFAYLGDQWSRDHLVIVWLAGIVPALVATTCMCCYSDNATVQSNSKTSSRLDLFPDGEEQFGYLPPLFLFFLFLSFF